MPQHPNQEHQIQLETAAEAENCAQPTGAARHAEYDRLKAATTVFSRFAALDERELLREAQRHGIQAESNTPRTRLIQQLVAAGIAAEGLPLADGILEVLPAGFAFLRSPANECLSSNSDVYVSPSQVRRFELRTGMHVIGIARPPETGERFTALLRVECIEGESPEVVRRRPSFETLTPVHPNRRLVLENGAGEYSCRILDLLAPIGLGQRALIVSPPRSGKTMLLKALAQGIKANQPWIDLIMLLVDERPEEVTDLRRSVPGEVVSSTFDSTSARHCQVAHIVIERARRLVEAGRHVVVLLDSLTRLARAHNTESPNSGRILSGGVDSTALQRPKRFFGAARSIEGGGSLTIIATALVDTGSRMDEVIFEEFKGTGNLEVILNRKAAEQRIFPAIDVAHTGTRKEDLLMDPDELRRVTALRRVLSALNPEDGLELLLQRLQRTRNNAEFLLSMSV